ncbi:MAG: DUF167 domain-containing protein [Patescibacteria group bacterium]
MRIFIKAKPKRKKKEVRKIKNTHFIVSVKEAPADGKANRAIERAIAEYLRIPASRVRIVSGRTSRKR